MIKNVPNRKLKKASARKRRGGKTYYVLGDDYNSLCVLAKLRGYLSSKKTIQTKYGYQTIEVSAVTQMIAENE